MNVNEFFKYFSEPNLLNKETLRELEEVIERYPYFQAARLLYLKNLYLLNDDQYQQILEQYSLYFPHRKSIFQFIHATNIFEENDIDKQASPNSAESNQSYIEPTQEEKIIQLSLNTNNISENYSTSNNQDEASNNNVHIADIILNKLRAQSEPKNNNNTSVPQENTLKETSPITQEKSFLEWLEENNYPPSSPNANEANIKDSINVIDTFLNNLNNIEKIKPSDNETNEDLTNNYIPPENLEIVSEQLAQIYYQQGHLEQALKMYEKLFLKYPEKSIYFANLIQEIKQKLDKN
ncbi:MAG: hypothetical protein N2449_04590 [Bacteroidales bacterium]|nr:hypothetical protein [Bacteroidales bacterium]